MRWKPLESFDQRSEIIRLRFKKDNFGCCLKVDLRGQGWKQEDQLEGFIVIQVKDEGDLD